MNNIFYGLFDCVKKRKGYFLFLLILSVVAIVLGVIGAINLSELTIDLSNISYIKFLKGGGYGAMLFSLLLSLSIFFFAILICHIRPFLLPLGFVFYLYLIYSQTFILINILLIYGIFNCMILFILLIIYYLILWFLFLMLMCELLNLVKINNYFKTCFSLRESKVMVWLTCLIVLSVVFSLILLILEKFVILLIFN